MTAIITGDIINSKNYPLSDWLPVLKRYFSELGETPETWEVYRGDEFQLRIPLEDALAIAIRIKALIKGVKGLDVRMAIGMGTETFTGLGVSESNGPAYQRSGRSFESIKRGKTNLVIATGNAALDATLNLMLQLALDFMDDWTVVSAEIVSIALADPTTSQQVMAARLGIRQSAVSQRQKRARLDLVHELLAYYKKRIKAQFL